MASGSREQQAKHSGPDPDHPPFLKQRAPRIEAQGQGRDDTERQHRQKWLQAASADRAWNDEAPIADEGNAEQRDALPRIGQGRQHREVPEQDLEQQRQVADELDIDLADAGQQPIG
ncbi:hypothetical protein ABIF76_000108 [Bradyrhizobium ottawaense]